MEDSISPIYPQIFIFKQDTRYYSALTHNVTMHPIWFDKHESVKSM